MKNKLICALLALSLLTLLAGCNPSESGGLGSAIKSFISGDVSGELNKSYSTKWFDFTVQTIKSAYQYGDYEAPDGYKFVIVSISETNTFDKPIPMSAYDFSLDADGILEEDTYPYEPFEDGMMPEEFELAVGESQTYDVVFSIPDEMIDIRFVYIEIAEDESVGATFTIHHAL